MLNYLSFRYKLYKLGKISKAMKLEYEAIEKTVTQQEDMADVTFLGYDIYSFDMRVKKIISDYYKHEANKYLIPLPSISSAGMYTTFDFDDLGSVTFLTPKGVYSLRKTIREEKKLKRETIGFYITSITGLIGAIIGLISFLPK
ncbi:TPA: hypothetical protein ACX6SY_001780 [Photobacterium damselae]